MHGAACGGRACAPRGVGPRSRRCPLLRRRLRGRCGGLARSMRARSRHRGGRARLSGARRRGAPFAFSRRAVGPRSRTARLGRDLRAVVGRARPLVGLLQQGTRARRLPRSRPARRARATRGAEGGGRTRGARRGSARLGPAREGDPWPLPGWREDCSPAEPRRLLERAGARRRLRAAVRALARDAGSAAAGGPRRRWVARLPRRRVDPARGISDRGRGG